MINESFIYSVSQLNSKVRFFLEENFFLIRVEGEISNFSKPTSSHMYFSLKDTSSQIRCSMFHNRNKDLTFSPKNGMHVLVEALVSLYEKRGDYQLIVQSMEFKGDGLLREKFEKLKQKLFSSGLFDEKHKKKIPLFPKCVGIISSPTGAAVKDVITIIKRRSFNIDMIIYPTQTQGDKAQHQIVEAIDLANKRRECDVLILTRGGGTLEDIWSFNEESVANSVFNSSLPIVSAVGHEIDFTITDFVADLRASTPSAAAELVSAKSYELKQIIEDSKTKLVNLINNKLQLAKFSLSNLLLRLGHPKKQIENSPKIVSIFIGMLLLIKKY